LIEKPIISILYPANRGIIMNIDKISGAKIKTEREGSGLSQEALAKWCLLRDASAVAD
jgi:DNA-binding transcriptional regulator YiaG